MTVEEIEFSAALWRQRLDTQAISKHMSRWNAALDEAAIYNSMGLIRERARQIEAPAAEPVREG